MRIRIRGTGSSPTELLVKMTYWRISVKSILWFKKNGNKQNRCASKTIFKVLPNISILKISFDQIYHIRYSNFRIKNNFKKCLYKFFYDDIGAGQLCLYFIFTQLVMVYFLVNTFFWALVYGFKQNFSKPLNFFLF